MEKRNFGKTGLSVSPLGFGGAEIGFEGIDQATAGAIINEALDNGLNVIDTAECYWGSEELLGNILGKRREQIHLFTKCGHNEKWENPAWTAKDIEISIDRSLKRLKTDFVDLLQLHSCSKDILARGEAIETLQKIKQAGKSRFIGYSGDGQDALYAVNTGAFDTLQTSINIADQEALQLTLPIAMQKNMGVIAKRPIANAVFLQKDKPSGEYYIPYWERLQELKYGFLSNDAKQMIDTALRFTLSAPGVHTAIVGTAKLGRYAENVQLLNKGNLSAAEYDAIRTKWKNIATPEWIGQI